MTRENPKKWCRVLVGDREIYGVVDGNEIVEVEGSPFRSYAATSQRHQIGDVRFLIPTVPSTCYTSGNYLEHLVWAKEYGLISEFRESKRVPGYRSRNSMIATDEDITIPGDAVGEVHYEAELIAVIGKTAKGLSESNALSCVLGFTLGNDVSIREWSKQDHSGFRGKDSDGTHPVGPAIATGIDPMALELTTRINGTVVSNYSTSDPIYTAAQSIALISRYQTMQPGDIIWLGTQGATLPPLEDGDVVEISCPEIGTLRNRVTRLETADYPPTGISAWDDN